MSDSNSADDGLHASRRSVLLGLGAGAAGTVVGASGGVAAQDGETEGTETASTETETPETEETGTESEEQENGDDADEAATYVRAAHMVRGAPAVTARVDDEEIEELANIEYQVVTEYAPLSPGVHEFRAELPSMDGTAIYDARGALGSGAFTVVALGDLEAGESPVPLLLQDEFGPGSGLPEQAQGRGQGRGQEQGQGPGPDRTRLRVVHAVPGAPSVTVTTGGGSTLFEEAEYAGATPYTSVPSGSRTIRIRPADDEETVLAEFDVTLEEGTNYTAFAAASSDGEGVEPVLATDALEQDG